MDDNDNVLVHADDIDQQKSQTIKGVNSYHSHAINNRHNCVRFVKWFNCLTNKVEDSLFL